MDLRNKKVTVVGLGSSGMGSVLLLERVGAIVSVTDNQDNEVVRKNALCLEKKYTDLEIGKHTEQFLKETELLVVSPGVEKPSLPIRYAQNNNIPIMSELELGYFFCEGPIVAVTGTNGKSTVVSLLGEIFHRAGIPVNVCGNIGNSLSGEVCAIGGSVCGGKNMAEKTIFVVEVSSFQLEWIESFRPKISVILNITEDHLDRYNGFGKYLDAKKRIYKNQRSGDIVIFNYDDKNLRGLAEVDKITAKVLYFSAKKKVEGIYCDKYGIKILLNKKKRTFRPGGTKLEGVHNTENILASVLVATLFGAKEDSIEKAVKNFEPLPHRFQRIAIIEGVEFIDDSKATNVDSTYRALSSLGKKAVLIAGGKDKNLSYGNIKPLVKNNIKKIILIGETKSKMRDAFKNIVPLAESDSLAEAVFTAYKSASRGECVLLSPMCSSFDMFRDYKHRGEIFKESVEKLKPRSNSK